MSDVRCDDGTALLALRRRPTEGACWPSLSMEVGGIVARVDAPQPWILGNPRLGDVACETSPTGAEGRR